jgi:hypothetical protein
MTVNCRGCTSLISAPKKGALCSRCAWSEKLADEDVDRLTGRKRKACRATRGAGFFGTRAEELALERLSLDLIDDEAGQGIDDVDGIFSRGKNRADGQRWIMN